MVLFNYATKEITAKIVYYGPGLCGKTTNLQFIYDSLPSNNKSKMLSLSTKTDRTLFFDFLPLDLGKIRGMRTKLQLYTVPGQVYYNSTRQLVLKGADGIVFVADSQDFALDANQESSFFFCHFQERQVFEPAGVAERRLDEYDRYVGAEPMILADSNFFVGQAMVARPARDKHGKIHGPQTLPKKARGIVNVFETGEAQFGRAQTARNHRCD